MTQIDSNSENVNEKHNQSLTLAPKTLKTPEDIKKIQPYLNSLGASLANQDITNIALTGAYGAGKSTILDTFQDIYKNEYNFLNISLASFTDISPNETKATKEEFERKLEISILQQIFYHVEPNEIPDSRFKRITYFTKKELQLYGACFIIWLISSLILFQFSYISKLNPDNWTYNFSELDIWAIIFLSIFFLGIGTFSNAIITLFRNSKINKVNLRGEIELGDKLEKSIFNEHLEEILYFFEKTNYNVVVIEDLDRFDTTEIFTKLREINILLNNAKTIHRKIKFVYAIRDDIFNDKTERVKFFDYIIPIIPFINPSNAKDKLTKLIDEAGLTGTLSNEFTSDVVSFINDIDMRLLTNIFHEYVLYKENLSNGLIQENLFAIITYKNLYPQDFINLHKRNGNLYNLIGNKSKYTEDILKNIDTEIESRSKKIKEIEKENVVDLEELRAIYINRVLAKLPENVFTTPERILELVKQNEFENSIMNGELICNRFIYQPMYSRYALDESYKFDFEFPEIENEINPEFNYGEREENLICKSNGSIELLKREIEELNSRKNEIESWDLKQIFEKVLIDDYLEGDFKDNDLIRMLILEGYINENYDDYISIFHEGNLTSEDFNFLKSIKANRISPFNLKLNNIENLIKELRPSYWNRKAILNFSLLDFLGNNFDEYKEQYCMILDVLSNSEDNSMKFIDEYIQNDERPLERFFTEIIKKWGDFWKTISESYSLEKQQYYLSKLLINVDIDELISYQSSQALLKTINRSGNLFLNNNKIPKEKKEKLIDALEVKFENLTEPNHDLSDLLDLIYENDYYQLNIENLRFIIDKYGNQLNNQEDFDNRNFTAIQDSDCFDLIVYVNNNIEDYVKNIFLKLTNKEETEENFIFLLNHTKIGISFKNLILRKCKPSFFDDISKIEVFNVKKQLFEENKVYPNWINVINYFESQEEKLIDITLFNYLNNENNSQELCYHKIDKVLINKEREVLKNFYNQILQNNDFDLDTYKLYLEPVPDFCKYNQKFHFEHLEKEKVAELINLKILSYSPEIYTKLKSKFSDLHITLIEINQYPISNKFKDYNYDLTDIEKILESIIIEDENKVALILSVANKVISKTKWIDNKVCKLLVENKEDSELPFNILLSLIKTATENNIKLKLIIKVHEKLDNLQLQNLVENVSPQYQEIFWKGKMPTIEKKETNEILLKILSERNLISRFEIDKKKNDFYRVYALRK